jgi:perosamine synthetase
MRYIAPAGTPISAGDLWRWLGSLPRKRQVLEEFRGQLTERFGLAGCEFVSSGRAGLTLLLQMLHELRGEAQRNEVVIPGYTCFSVPASIERAGLRVRVCDIDPKTLSYDLGKLADFDFSRVLAIVSANLYGMPNDLGAIEAVARRHGVYMVDDAAQALGASYAGRPAGTFGDVGLFSLDKGKNITSMQGGILVTRDPRIARSLKERVDTLPPPSLADTALQVFKLLAYAALLPPSNYAITRKLPFLGLGRTPYMIPSPLTRYSPSLGAMASILHGRLEQLGAIRRDNARRIRETLADALGMHVVTPPPSAEAVYVRMPLIAPSRAARDVLVRSLESAGIGATISYPTAIVDIPELRAGIDRRDLDCPTSRTVAERILTVPTHAFVNCSDIARIAMAVREVCVVDALPDDLGSSRASL